MSANPQFGAVLGLPAGQRRNEYQIAGEDDPANPEVGTKRRKRLVEALVSNTSEFIQGDLRRSLQAGLHDCRVVADPNDSEDMGSVSV